MADANLPTVIVVGALPPPIHGQAAINAAVVEHLKRLPVALTVANISPGNARKNIRYHLNRVFGTLRAAKEVAVRRGAHAKTLYMPFQAGNGIVYNFLLAAVARLTGFRIVLHHHSSAHTLHHRTSFALLARLCGRRAVHVALSAGMAHDFEKRYRLAARTVVSSNACHIQPPGNPAPKSLDETLIVGLLANLNAEKGLQLAIDAVISARAKGQKVRLVLAGPLRGPEAEQSVARASRILGESLEVWGPVTGLNKERFFQYIHVFLFPTTYRYEAQPLVIYEALSHRLPIVSTDAGYIGEMLANTGTVVRIGPQIVDRLAAELMKFRENPDLLTNAAADSELEFERAVQNSRREFSLLCHTLVAEE